MRPPLPIRRLHATWRAGLVLALGLGCDATARADEPPTERERDRGGFVRIDAIFVERLDSWWLIDDGVRSKPSPRWTADASAARTLAAEGVRDVLDAIERGEGGGWADGTGRTVPPPPAPATACGIALLASVREVAVVFVLDASGRSRVVRASRTLESGTRPIGPPTARDASPGAWARERRSDALAAVRWCALLGDATGTLRLTLAARAKASSTEGASLDLLEAQALERLGRFDEAAQALTRCAEGTGVRAQDDSITASAAIEARRQAARVRARSLDGASHGAETAQGELPRGPGLDDALGALPGLADRGRTAQAVAAVADAVRRTPRGARIHAHARRRALLAAAALALDEGDRTNARALLAPLLDAPLPDDLAPTLDALVARADVIGSRGSSSPGPPVGKTDRGG